MADKLLISGLTWRSKEMQKAAYPDMPFFVAPDEITAMLRPTRRQAVDRIHVLSLACIADTEKALREFLMLAKERGCHIVSKEENQGFYFTKKSDIEHIVNEWRLARNRGAAKIGGRISADLREKEHRAACAVIAERWPLPNDEWRTPDLLKEAGKSIKKKKISYNTAIKYLGKRPIAQYNHQAKLKRKANAKR